MTVILFLIVLAILILVHEFGHFIVAKKSGIRVDEFGLGFPPKIFAKKWGSTTYTLNLLPFGGFVKIFGEDPHAEEISEAEKSTSFYYKPKWIQSLVLVAGITMNLLFAWLLISLGFVIGFPASTDYSGFGKVSNPHLVITEVIPDSPAQTAGLISGDQIVEVVSNAGDVKGNPDPSAVTNVVRNSTGDVEISYIRGKSDIKTISVTPTSSDDTKLRTVGIAMDTIGTLKLPIHLALLEGARTTGLLIKETVVGLAVFFWDTLRLHSDLSQVSGPVGIARVVGQASNLGFVYLLSIIALISINLAVINLLPFPALDGGRLFFILIEAITRKPIPQAFVRRANIIGFALLLGLMIVVTGHDILKLL